MAPDKLSRDPSQGGGEPPEGVRIIAAEELEEVAERGEVVRRRSPDEPGFKDRPPAPPADARPAIRFPLPDSADPSALERPRPAPVEAPRAEGSVPDRPRPEATPVSLGEEESPAEPSAPRPDETPAHRFSPAVAADADDDRRSAPGAAGLRRSGRRPRRASGPSGSARARPRPVHRRAPAPALDRAAHRRGPEGRHRRRRGRPRRRGALDLLRQHRAPLARRARHVRARRPHGRPGRARARTSRWPSASAPSTPPSGWPTTPT